MVIDTNKNSVSFINIGVNGYNGAVLAPNSKIYCIPFEATNVLVIDPNTNGFTIPQGLTGLPAGPKYVGGVLANNGKIYCLPGGNTNNVLIIDPSNDTMDTNTITGVGGDFNYWAGCLGIDGNIYSFPTFNGSSILSINPNNNSILYISIPTLFNPKQGWIGCVNAPNGYIYSIPFDWNQNNSLVLDPIGKTIIRIIPNIGVNDPTMSGDDFYRKCIGGVLAPNGDIYGIPYRFNFIPIIKTGLPKYPPWMLDAYYNKL